MDTSLKGDDAMWQEVEYYMANRGNHTLMWSRVSLERMVTFLYSKTRHSAIKTLPSIKEI